MNHCKEFITAIDRDPQGSCCKILILDTLTTKSLPFDATAAWTKSSNDKLELVYYIAHIAQKSKVRGQ